VRRRTDRLYPPRRLAPREEAAARLVAERPGITVDELAGALGVGVKRTWQLLERLEARGRVERQSAPPMRRGPRR
jgi:DNA-binding MarR family transcriptional regulator